MNYLSLGSLKLLTCFLYTKTPRTAITFNHFSVEEISPILEELIYNKIDCLFRIEKIYTQGFDGDYENKTNEIIKGCVGDLIENNHLNLDWEESGVPELISEDSIKPIDFKKWIDKTLSTNTDPILISFLKDYFIITEIEAAANVNRRKLKQFWGRYLTEYKKEQLRASSGHRQTFSNSRDIVRASIVDSIKQANQTSITIDISQLYERAPKIGNPSIVEALINLETDDFIEILSANFEKSTIKFFMTVHLKPKSKAWFLKENQIAIFRYKGIKLNVLTRTISRKAKKISLKNKTLKLIQLFFKNQKSRITIHQILDTVYGDATHEKIYKADLHKIQSLKSEANNKFKLLPNLATNKSVHIEQKKDSESNHEFWLTTISH